jgi:predicted MFS family arabinose efflux permease
VFVFISTLVLTRLRDAGQADRAGWMYGGVGVGIALTASVVLTVPVRDSAALWIAFGALSAVILAAAAMTLPAKPSAGAAGHEAPQPTAPAARGGRKLLLLAYSLEGIGYIISATFIVTVINSAQGDYESGAWAWVVVGLAGIPACVLWTRRADYRGLLARLTTAYWIQAAGIVAIALAPASRAAALLSAATLGGTLTGVVLLTMMLAPRIDPEHPRRTVGQLTIGFSVGQMLGPLLAGYTAHYTGSYGPALLGSAALIAISALATHGMAAAGARN